MKALPKSAVILEEESIEFLKVILTRSYLNTSLKLFPKAVMATLTEFSVGLISMGFVILTKSRMS
jgi:hypothetical protein